MAYVLKINGVSHEVSFVDGKAVYSPPLNESKSEKRKNADRLKGILESRKCPGINTDTTFLSGIGTLEQQFDGDVEGMNEVISAARRKGFNPTSGMFYYEPLARYVGDPEAFLSAGDGKGRIRDVCEKRGWGCRGTVNVKARQPEEDPLKNPKVPLAESIVREEVGRLRQDPSNQKKPERELREQVLDKHALKL